MTHAPALLPTPVQPVRFPLALVTGFLLLFMAVLLMAGGAPIPLIGLTYAVAFWLVAWSAPHLALAFVFCSAPFQQDLSGGSAAKFSIAEINLLLTLPILLLRSLLRLRIPSLGPIGIPVLLYLLLSLGSSLQNWQGLAAIRALVQMGVYLVAAVMLFASFARREEDLLKVLGAFVYVGVFLAFMVLATQQNYVLGLHKNGIGASLACALVVTLELWFAAEAGKRKQFLLLALAVMAGALVLTLSRGAWVGALGGLATITVLRRQFSLLLRAGVVLAIVAPLCWQLVPQEQRVYAFDFDRKRFNIRTRHANAEAAKRQFLTRPLTGVGVGLRKSLDATNVFWFTLAETGILGLGAFLLIHAVFFWMLWRAQGAFSRSDPLYSLLAVGGALVLSKLLHGMVDHYWSRGHLLLAWSSAGMATAAYWAALARVRDARRAE